MSFTRETLRSNWIKGNSAITDNKCFINKNFVKKKKNHWMYFLQADIFNTYTYIHTKNDHMKDKVQNYNL